jgi:hypothetical protein
MDDQQDPPEEGTGVEQAPRMRVAGESASVRALRPAERGAGKEQRRQGTERHAGPRRARRHPPSRAFFVNR